MLDRVRRVVTDLPAPADVGDGSCLVWEPRITGFLRDRGLLARRVLVLGYGSVAGFGERELVLFGHQATCVGGAGGEVIVDYTARQFDRALPVRWVTDPDSYIGTLAAATGASRVELCP